MFKNNRLMKLIMSDRSIENLGMTGPDVVYVDLSSKKIANCVGCFGCWTKTPGKCVIRDDATSVYPYIAKSDTVLYVSKVKYGGYDSIMKTMLERSIPVQQAFIRILNGETHHVQRAVKMKKATIIAYGDLSDEEKTLFSDMVARNAANVNFESHRIIFVTEDMVGQTVKEVMKEWERQ